MRWQYKPKPKKETPRLGQTKRSLDFPFFPIRCPKSNIVYWLEKVQLTYEYTGITGHNCSYGYQLVDVIPA